MDGSAAAFLFLGAIALAIVLRLIAGSLDGERIAKYVGERGGELLEKSWNPFGKGWFGERSDRIYEIRYRDAKGRVHTATAKTSMFSGVYLTDDRSIERKSEQTATERDESGRDELSQLREENERLRRELAERREPDGA
jgi:hypothetical protein